MTEPDEPAALDRQCEMRGALACGGGCLAVSILLSGALVVAILSTRGRFNAIFMDLGTDLPAITNIACSDLFVWLAAVVPGLAIVAGALWKGRTAEARCNAIAIFAALFLGAVYVVGMVLPLLTLITRLQD
jgi:hypothetical protein